MKRFLIVFIVVLTVPTLVFGADDGEYESYLSNYDLSVFREELDSETYELLSELGIDDFDYSSISSLSFETVLKILKKLAQGKAKSPMKSMISVLFFIVLSALFQSLKANGDEELSGIFSSCAALIMAIILVAEISPSITIAVAAVKLAGDFIFAFVPVFCAIVIASGGITTSFATNSMLLMLSQGLSFISANVFMPLVNCFLAVGICSSIRSELNLGNLINSARKGITNAMSLLSAGFVSVLSMKTAVSARADILGLRSIRFVINSVVPVIGGSVSEGLLSIQSYSSLIKSSVGIVGIIAIALIFLPSIIEIMLWRAALSVSSLISEVFGDTSVSLVLRTFKDAALLINVILVLSMVTTIVSFGVLIAARSG